jgi:polysaccharide export outer membrane protein
MPRPPQRRRPFRCSNARGGSLCALLALVLGAGCGGFPLAPARPDTSSAVRRLGLADDRPKVEVLRPGDVVSIATQVVDEERVRNSTVDALGNLHVESKHDVRVAGLTLQQAERRITEALRKRDQFIHVELQYVQRAGQQISVIGAVKNPGRVQLQPAMRVADLLAAAGGILMQEQERSSVAFEWADVERSVVLREGVPLPISMREAMRDTPHHNVRVLPGDVLYVPYAADHTVTVLGQVGGALVLPHHEGMRLTEALSAAGGVTPGGDKDDIRILRGAFEMPTVYVASLADIADGEQHDVELAVGDTVYVEDSFLEDAAEVVSVIFPFISVALVVASGVLFFTQSP